VKDGAIGMFRKAALKVGVPTLFAFMTWNAYLAVNHLKQMHKIATLTLESSMIQADISGVLKDLTDMETGQRGFLLTNDPSYLQPYSDAKGRIATDFADLRVGLANRTERERSLESPARVLG
jgi:CHASE3 domain sensor protein